MKILKWTTLLGVASTALLMSVQVIAVPPLKDTGGNAGGGNEDCPDGTEQVAKFETTNSGSYNVVDGSANGVVISGATLTGGSWTSTTPMSYVIVKGGNQGAVTTNVGGATSGTFSNSNLPENNGNLPDISNIKFCTGGGDEPQVQCKVCEPREDVMAEPTSVDFFPKTVPLTCEVSDKNGNPISGAEVVVSDISVTTNAEGVAEFDVPWNPSDLNLLSIVKANVADIGDISEAEVDAIRSATYAQLPVEISYAATATANGKSASDEVIVKLTQDNVDIEHVTHEHSHGTGHVKFSFFDGYCIVTDGEDAPPVALRVWQPMPELINLFPRGLLPGDMFTPGTHYKVVAPDQAEYILEKIDDAGKSTFEPVIHLK